MKLNPSTSYQLQRTRQYDSKYKKTRSELKSLRLNSTSNKNTKRAQINHNILGIMI